MVKLAEPRTKKRYNLVPRGKALYEDESRFGTKMLEKMGWTKGKGLGAREEGSNDFVHVRYKHDAEGLGYEARDDQWTQHEESFNGLLKKLTENTSGKDSNEANDASDVENRAFGLGFSQPVDHNDDTSLKAKISGQSLEERSKQSRARVHYKKFTRGKDLAQYSEKDLANIFGKKAPANSVKPEQIEMKGNNEKISNDNEEEGSFQKSTLSVSDYFKEKMETFKKRQNELSIENGNPAVENENVEEIKEMAQEKSEKKKKKKNRKETEIETKIVDQIQDEKNDKGIEVMETSSVQNEIVKEKRKSKKKDKKCKDVTKDESAPCTNMAIIEPIKQKKKSKRKAEAEKQSQCEEIVKQATKELTDSTKRRRMNSMSQEKVTSKSKKQKIENQMENKENSSKVQEKKKSNEEKPQDADASDENEVFTLDKMFEELKASHIYEISHFVAEQFRFADISGFKGANLPDISGYCIPEHVKLKVTKRENDQKRILRMWAGVMSKYELGQSVKDPYQHYAQLARDARENNERQPRFQTYKYAKRNAFKLVTI